MRREGDRVRITARLVETAGRDASLVRHLRASPDRLSRRCRRMSRRTSRGRWRWSSRPTARARAPQLPCDPAAYQAYLKGRYYWNKPFDDGLNEAIAFYERALASSPSFGAAHAALGARTRGARRVLPRAAATGAEGGARVGGARARARRAPRTRPGSPRRTPDACTIWTGRAPSSAYTQAIALNPSYESAHRGYGVMLSVLGRHGEAIRETERACELDPLCLVVGTTAAWVRYAAGDYDAAIDHCRNTIDMDPEFMAARRLLGAAYLQAGRDGGGDRGTAVRGDARRRRSGAAGVAGAREGGHGIPDARPRS